MQALLPLIQIEFVVSVLCGFSILYMQIRAYRMHRKKFFVTLANSTIFALVATFLCATSYFVPVPESLTLVLYRLSIPVGILSSVLAAWGSIQFFLAYDAK